MSLSSTDLRLVICTFGAISFSNYGEGSAIQIDPEADLFNQKVSADGKTTRSRSHNSNYQATITLMESANAHGGMISQTLRNAGISGITYPFTYNDPKTGEYVFSATAYVNKMPGISKSNEPTEREWGIYLPDCLLTPVDNLNFGYRPEVI
ncbi:MAG: hypothetical protein IV090_24640 [Candidatus Sericytochromatia bacterium]|nr:hypothetical protein [Candidatus Sericytochromatia bacterium]